ncbi:MAG: histidine kinase, partial [Bacteroidetes bacterium]
MKKVRAGGGWSAIAYSYRKARESGGVLKFWRALRSKNTCKTCALGMGGQKGGMVNELGQFPEVCKKSLQAMAADMQAGIPHEFWTQNTAADLKKLSPRQLESTGRLVDPLLYTRKTEKYERIEWERAFDLISDRLRNTAA